MPHFYRGTTFTNRFTACLNLSRSRWNARYVCLCYLHHCDSGRLLFLLKQKHLRATFIKLFVLDEADKLFEPDFAKDIK